MLNDFENVKKQLTDLVPLINALQSEATQARVVELLIGGADKGQGYDLKLLNELWETDYKGLVTAAGEKGGRLREPRFVMQARVAYEARNMARVTALLAVATAMFAAGTLIVELMKLSR